MDANRKAFLDMIAWSEGTSTSPATRCNGYDVIVTGTDKKPEVFADFSTHPFANGRKSKAVNNHGLTSNASGRYQFMLKDYAYYTNLLKLADYPGGAFGPEAQDIRAIQLIRERRALADVDEGRIVTAIRKCSNIWASFPGANYNQPENAMSKLLDAYVKAGGTFGNINA